MVKEMLARVGDTLKEMRILTERYKDLNGGKKSFGFDYKKFWKSIAWTTETSNIDALRTKVIIIVLFELKSPVTLTQQQLGNECSSGFV